MLFKKIIGKICIVRTYASGVHFGEIVGVSDDGKQCEIKNSRRVWRWYGAATLSELAVSGTKKPESCKIPIPVETQYVTDALEYIPMTDTAISSLEKVSIWTA